MWTVFFSIRVCDIFKNGYCVTWKHFYRAVLYVYIVSLFTNSINLFFFSSNQWQILILYLVCHTLWISNNFSKKKKKKNQTYSWHFCCPHKNRRHLDSFLVHLMVSGAVMPLAYTNNHFPGQQHTFYKCWLTQALVLAAIPWKMSACVLWVWSLCW